MKAHAPKCSRARGFTLIELLVTVALVGIAASIVLPLATMTVQRAKEAELRQALRTIRQALDDFKSAADAGIIDKATGSSGYPADLKMLVEGVRKSAAAGADPKPFILLRRLPRNPFFPDASAPPALTWRTRSYGAPTGDFSGGPDVFDVAPITEQRALDGSSLADW